MSINSTILVVDETQADVDFLLGFLGDQFDVLVALGGQRALKILNEKRVDLLLVNTAMSLMDGFELCQKIKANDAVKNIPIIFVTASGNEEDIDCIYEAGGADFVTLPCRGKELLTRIKTQLEIKTLQSSLLQERDAAHAARQALGENQQKLQALFDNTPDGILIVNGDGDIEACNFSILAMSGFERDELINAHFDLLLPDCNNILVEYERNDGSIDGIVDAKRISMVVSSGKEFSVELSLFHYHQEDGVHYAILLRDNTERQMKEALLRSSEEKLRTIIENASNVICTMNQYGQFTFLSPAWSEHLGYSVANGLGKLMDQFIHDEDVETFRQALVQYENGEFPRFECRLIHSSGALRWFTVSGRLVKEGNNNSQFYVMVLEDITEHKGVVQALTESEERFRLLFESMNHGVVVIDDQGTPVVANQAVEKILGISYLTLVEKLENREIELIDEQQRPVKLSEFPPFITLQTGKSFNDRDRKSVV